MKKKICIVTTMWKRHRLTNLIFKYYKEVKKRLASQVTLEFIVSGSEGKVSEKIAKDNGFHYLEKDNYPLNLKWNAGLLKAKELNGDGIVIIGSDDILNDEIFLFFKDRLEDPKYNNRPVGFKDIYFLSDIKHPKIPKFLHWPGYTNYRKGDTAGAGRFFPKKVLDKVGWGLYKSRPQNIHLDGIITTKLKKYGVIIDAIKLQSINGLMIDIKSGFNLSTLLSKNNIPKFGTKRGNMELFKKNSYIPFNEIKEIIKTEPQHPHPFRNSSPGEIDKFKYNIVQKLVPRNDINNSFKLVTTNKNSK